MTAQPLACSTAILLVNMPSSGACLRLAQLQPQSLTCCPLALLPPSSPSYRPWESGPVNPPRDPLMVLYKQHPNTLPQPSERRDEYIPAREPVNSLLPRSVFTGFCLRALAFAVSSGVKKLQNFARLPCHACHLLRELPSACLARGLFTPHCVPSTLGQTTLVYVIFSLHQDPVSSPCLG